MILEEHKLLIDTLDEEISDLDEILKCRKEFTAKPDPLSQMYKDLRFVRREVSVSNYQTLCTIKLKLHTTRNIYINHTFCSKHRSKNTPHPIFKITLNHNILIKHKNTTCLYPHYFQFRRFTLPGMERFEADPTRMMTATMSPCRQIKEADLQSRMLRIYIVLSHKIQSRKFKLFLVTGSSTFQLSKLNCNIILTCTANKFFKLTNIKTTLNIIFIFQTTMEAGAEILTCTQSRGAIASLLDWLSKQPESEAQQTAKRKAEDLIQNPYLTYDAAHALIFKTTRDLGSKTYFIRGQRNGRRPKDGRTGQHLLPYIHLHQKS